MRLTASDIVTAIGHLPRNRTYHYVNPNTRDQIEIVNVVHPEGPIVIKRYSPSEGETSAGATESSISTQMIWRVANAFRPNQPINFDRILGGSYNTRSVLEALLAYTPQFYACKPGRIELIDSSTRVKRGHKHLMWCPDKPHPSGALNFMETETVISEVPNLDVVYDALVVPDELRTAELDIEVQRRHAQIQIALLMIGNQLGYRVWIAQNDKGIVYRGKKIGEMDGVVPSLQDERVLSAFGEAIRIATLIDCVWFKNSRLMPAVMEVEDTTGITSGLTRMKKLQDVIPPVMTRYVIVAPDEERGKVYREGNLPQFRSLNVRYFPYSAVEELYGLCQKRRLSGAAVTEEFLDCYMETVLSTS